MDAITYGILEGVTGLVLAGQTAEKKAEREKREREAEQMKTGMANFVQLATGDPEIARNVVTNPGFAQLYQGLNIYDQAGIFASAAKAPMFNADQKSILESVKDDPGRVNSLLGDNRFLDKYGGDSIFMAL